MKGITMLKAAMLRLRTTLGYGLMHLITLPYYRFFRQNTLIPIRKIITSIEVGKEEDEIQRLLARWRDRKIYEYHFVQIAGTLLSGAVIGCFSWAQKDQEHWLGPASWYSCLILALFAILLSSSEAFIFSTLKDSSDPLPLPEAISMICQVRTGPTRTLKPMLSIDREGGKATSMERVNIRWNMVFTWQAPMMLLAYSVIAFILGLSIYIITPLYAEDDVLGGRSAAIFYLSGAGVSLATFVWCSFWAYKFVDIDRL